jgi:hypothetical protein
MSPQDRQLLQDFLNQLTQVRGVPKDPEAEAMIARAVAQQPDAPYLLVQRALLLEQALNNAKAEISALQSQCRGAAQGAPAFLDPNAWGNSGASRPAPAAQAGGQPYQMPAQPYQTPAQPYQMPQQAQAQAGSPGFLRGGMGGMLGNVAATAAGVAGGAFLFQGLEHLLGNHAGNGFLGTQSGFNSLTQPVVETINNFYGSDPSKNTADNAGADTSNNLVDNSSSDSSSGLDGTLDSDFTDDSDDGLFS